MARISFDEQVARWLRRSNPGYLGGRSESVGPPILPLAALEQYKIPQLLFMPSVVVLANATLVSQVVSTDTDTLLEFTDGYQSPGQQFATLPASGGTTLVIDQPGLYLVTANVFWEANAVGRRRTQLSNGTSSLGEFSLDFGVTDSSDSDVGSWQSHTQVHWYVPGDGVAIEVFQDSTGDLEVTAYQLSVVQLAAVVPEILALA